MDYKKEIIEMIDKINDDSLLEFFYRFIARVWNREHLRSHKLTVGRLLED